MPFFSIITPTYNRYAFLKRAIDSVLNQTFTDYEFIIVDDGSTDNTQQLKTEYSDKIKFISQKNKGVSSARNLGIKNAKGRFIAFLDSDDTWLPSKLQHQKNFIDNNPDIMIHQTEDIWIRNGRRVNPGKKHIKPEGDIFIPSLQLCLISPSSVVIQKDIFNTCGLFDELLPSCEDYDLWLRITCKHKVGLVKEKLIVRYAGHEDQLSSRYWGMDRFRIYSMLKLLTAKYSEIKTEYRAALVTECIKKSEIQAAGFEKRNKPEISRSFRKVIENLKDDNYKDIDYLNLLKKWYPL